jgi:hypothetical protein
LQRDFFVITQMRPHHALPQASMVGDEEMHQFMHDHVVPDGFLEIQQLGIEIQMTVGREYKPNKSPFPGNQIYLIILCPGFSPNVLRIFIECCQLRLNLSMPHLHFRPIPACRAKVTVPL